MSYISISEWAFFQIYLANFYNERFVVRCEASCGKYKGNLQEITLQIIDKFSGLESARL